MADAFHYPQDVFDLLVSTIPLLSRSKQGVVQFLRGAGVQEIDLADVALHVEASPDEISKFEIARRVLTRVNARNDDGLTPRREIVRQVVEFDAFEACWPTDQVKAREFVASVRKALDAKDSFTRLKNEMDLERERALAREREEQAAAAARLAKVEDLQARISSLPSLGHHSRNELLESVLNDLFRAYSIQVRQDFRCSGPASNAQSRFEGVIELDGVVHLVEMQWLNAPADVADISAFLARLLADPVASGIYLSSTSFAQPAVDACAEALNQRPVFLCSLREIEALLDRKEDLFRFLKKKSRAAVVDHDSYLEIL